MATMDSGDYPSGGQEYGTGQMFGAAPYYPGQPGSPPPTYRAWGIIAVIGGVLFNLILGVPTALAARRYAREVPRLWESGDVQAAVRASRKARAWLIASSVLDVLGVILVVAIIVVKATSPDFNNPSVVAASIKSETQQRLSKLSVPAGVPAISVSSVVCTRAGATTDHCVITFSDGSTVTKTATISGDGTGYSTN
jgi:hypothetical protein